MASNLQLSTASQNAEVNALVALANTGYIRIYDGVQPANANTAVSTQVLLAELRFGATAFGASSSGTATANAITDDSSANNTGTASWFRVLESNGTSVLWDGSVGAGGTFDLVLNTVSIVAAATVSITSMTYTHPPA
jgi:hypothetical protein